MIRLFIFILSTISESFAVQSQILDQVICGYQGANSNGVFVKNNVPARCEAILYGGNYFNITPPQADTDAIKALKLAGKTVYMLYMHDESSNLNQLIFRGNDLDNFTLPMINYLKENMIDGVVFGFLRLQTKIVIPYYATKVRALIQRVKDMVRYIQVGLFVTGLDALQFTNKDLFDFTVINGMVDMYVVDTSSAGAECRPNTTATGGRLPITSPDKTIVTLGQICNSTSKSKMDQSKVTVNFFIVATKLNASGFELSETYTNYCRRSYKDIWCGDSIQLFHDEVIYAKKVFKGIMLTFVDRDDMNNTCGCGDFPVTNSYIDAWENLPMKRCEAIS